VLWCAVGTRRRVPVGRRDDSAVSRGERLARLLFAGEWELQDSVWDVSSLWLVREGDWHATWVSFLATGAHWGWYVNFQTPYVRTSRGLSDDGSRARARGRSRPGLLAL